MSLNDMDARVQQVREAAATVNTQYQDQIATIRADTTLSPWGKQEKLDGLWEDASEKIAELQQQEKQIIADTTLQLQQKLYGTAGATSADVISYRDARDRASRLTDPRQAAAALQDAIRAKDDGLAKAIAAQAVTQRDEDPVALALGGGGGDAEQWVNVVQQYVDAYPAALATVNDLYTLAKRQNNKQTQFMSAMAYAVPRM